MSNPAESDRLAKLGYWLVFFGVILGTVAFGFVVHGDRDAAWRTAGGLLEILGLLQTGIAVDAKVARLKERPRTGERLLLWLGAASEQLHAWFNDLFCPDREGHTQAITAKSAGHGTMGGSVRTSRRPPDDAEVREWIEYLDGEVQDLRERTEKLQRKHRERLNRLSEQMKQTRRQLHAADQQLEDLFERLLIGGFQWELVGLGWFLVGVIFTTWGTMIV